MLVRSIIHIVTSCIYVSYIYLWYLWIMNIIWIIEICGGYRPDRYHVLYGIFFKIIVFVHWPRHLNMELKRTQYGFVCYFFMYIYCKVNTHILADYLPHLYYEIFGCTGQVSHQPFVYVINRNGENFHLLWQSYPYCTTGSVECKACARKYGRLDQKAWWRSPSQSQNAQYIIEYSRRICNSVWSRDYCSSATFHGKI